MANIHQIQLPITHNEDTHSEKERYCEVSIPLPESLVFNIEQLSLNLNSQNDNDSEVDTIDGICQIISYWPDGSIKWLKITYLAHYKANIYLGISKEQSDNNYTSNNEPEACIVITDDYQYKADAKTLSINLIENHIDLLNHNEESILSFTAKDLKLTDLNGVPIQAKFRHAKLIERSNLKPDSDSSVYLMIEGVFIDTLVSFKLNIDWLIPLNLLTCSVQIHNTNRAIHTDGKWDLGDPGSFNFKSLILDVHTNPTVSHPSHSLTNIEDNLSYIGDSLFCEQFSSGGVNWQSPVHVNKDNKVVMLKNGYELSVDGTKQSGTRCQPVLQLKNNLALRLDKFWQNFPASLKLKENTVFLGLFPETYYSHELQGGEKKSYTLFISLDSEINDLKANSPIHRSSINWQWISDVNLYPYLDQENSDLTPLQPIIDLGLAPSVGFISKRETLDEYGWRNFGDLYADHETSGYVGDDLFVSHYNNQYDPIYGFLRQYLISGNTKWFELADDLAKHVRDIDIYHTKLDKDEYNGGLFWHTDHYLKAFTSSHRSYSKYQSSDAYQDHAGGGGPGGQHCYTTGLYLHHCLTGNQESKDAVLTLSNWISHVYEGSGTCIELLLAFKNRHIPGAKNHFTGQYPLDRGTANYINALLDSFELTQQQNYLDRIEDIFANTMHPDEDVADRNLQDVENTWFYTVLLQSLCRYLQVKESRKEFDENFYYCRDCLLNYAEWMVQHEYPYLEKPNILEYPNDTWTAQDLRKAHVLAGAYYYSPDKQEKYAVKARYFQQYVAEELSKSDTKSYTRILVLLMQNQGMVESFLNSTSGISFNAMKTWPLASYQQTSVVSGLCKVMLKRVINLSLSAEINWLKKRLA
ncbi:hypothetical protein [Paraglaciecola sp. 2405UD69-4]|uniref:hypothetical protein n=1 Tax=Paraglaciecola sp. 2405UD69-4 TaxID=3391836 RepID=UPI0039C958D5